MTPGLLSSKGHTTLRLTKQHSDVRFARDGFAVSAWAVARASASGARGWMTGLSPVVAMGRSPSMARPARGVAKALSELTADQVRWDLTPAPWRSSDSLLSLAVKLLPGTDDKPTAVLVEELAILVTERDEQVTAMRSVQSAAFEELHNLRGEIVRLRDRLIELREERRRRLVAIPTPASTSGKDKAKPNGKRQLTRELKRTKEKRRPITGTTTSTRARTRPSGHAHDTP